MSVKGSVDFKLAFLAQDEASAVIAKLQKRMKDWSGQVKKGGEDAASFNVSIEGMAKGWANLNGFVELATTAIQGVRAALDSVVVGEMEANVGLAFEQLAGNAEKARQGMEGLRAATLGVVADVPLQQFANQMMFTGQALDRIMISLEAGSAIALATGQDVIQMSTAIAKAMNTGEAETLKNLGLTIDINKEMREYARTLGKVTGTLTLAEKRTVIMNAVTVGLQKQMRAAGVNTAKFETALQRARTAMENASSANGQFIASLGAAGSEWVNWTMQSEEWKKSIRGQTEAIIANDMALKEYIATTHIVEDAQAGTTTVMKKHARVVQTIGEAYDLAAPLALRLTKQLGLKEDRVRILTSRIALAIKGNRDWRDAVMDIALSAKNATDETKRLTDATKGQEEMARDAAAAAAEAAEVQTLKNQIDALATQLARAAIAGDTNRIMSIQRESLELKSQIEIIQNTITVKQKESRAETLRLQQQKERREKGKTEREKAAAEEAAQAARDVQSDLMILAGDERMSSLRFEIAKKSAHDLTNLQRATMENERADAVRAERDKRALYDIVSKTNEELDLDLLLHGETNRRRIREAEKADAEIRLQDLREANEKRMAVITVHAEASASAFAMASGPMNEILADQGKRMDDWMIVTSNAFETVGEVSKIASKNAQDWTKGLPGMLSASSGITAGLIKNKKQEAAVRGAFELAAGVSAAIFNPAQAAGHFASAALFFALSGNAGKKGGGSKQSQQGTFGGGGAQGAAVVSGGPSNVVLNVNGFVSADQNQLAKGMQDTLSGIAGGGFVGGTI